MSNVKFSKKELMEMPIEELRKLSYDERDSSFFSYMDEIDASIKEGEILLDIHSPEFLRQT